MQSSTCCLQSRYMHFKPLAGGAVCISVRWHCAGLKFLLLSTWSKSWLSFKMLICFHLCHEFFLNNFKQIEFFAFPESKCSFAPFQHFLHLSILISLFFCVRNLKLFICCHFALYDFILSSIGPVWKLKKKKKPIHLTVLLGI